MTPNKFELSDSVLFFTPVDAVRGRDRCPSGLTRMGWI